MSLLQKMRSLVVRDRTARNRAEHDAPADPANAGSRATGGGAAPGTGDSNSTTGTSRSDVFVGRAGGDESGDVGLSGGEARTGERTDGRTGAARDE